MDRRLTAPAVAASARRLVTHRLATVGVRQLATVAALLTVGASRAWATGPAMPWDTAVDNLLQNLSGPTARALVLMAIVATGLLWAFTRNEEGLKRVGQIAFGGAIAMGAVTLFANLGFTAGALL